MAFVLKNFTTARTSLRLFTIKSHTPMKQLYKTLLAGIPVFLTPLTGLNAQTVHELEADADTWIRIDMTVGEPRDEIIAEMIHGDDLALSIRSLEQTSEGGAVRERLAYVRFDLSGLDEDVLPGARFVIAADASTATWSSSQLHLWGLDTGANHTPQNWNEMTLNWDTIGAEVKQHLLGDGIFEGEDETRIDGPFLALAPASSDLDSSTGARFVPFEGEDLDAFIAERYADDGLVTFIIANRPGASRSIDFISREFPDPGFRPKLILSTGELPPVPTWAGLQISDFGSVNTETALGWLNIEDSPWQWSYSLGNFVYLQEEDFRTEWNVVFLPNTSATATPESWHDIESDEEGNALLQYFTGWVNLKHAPWVWSYYLDSYIYAPDGGLAEDGAWIWVP